MAATNPLLTADGSGGPGIDWATALARHDRWLRTVVLARLGERQAVDEVMQEVSLAAVAQAAPLADPSKLGAWLYRLAVRQVLLYRRGRGRHRKLAGRYARRVESGHGPAAGSGPDPLGWLLADERADLVRRALARLPPRDAEVLSLKYTEHWSYRELAAHLGVSEAAVEARLHRARARAPRRTGRHDPARGPAVNDADRRPYASDRLPRRRPNSTPMAAANSSPGSTASPTAGGAAGPGVPRCPGVARVPGPGRRGRGRPILDRPRPAAIAYPAPSPDSA